MVWEGRSREAPPYPDSLSGKHWSRLEQIEAIFDALGRKVDVDIRRVA